MNDNNNGKKSLGDAFDKLMSGRQLTVVEQFKRLADEALPTVRDFRAQGGDFMVAMGAEMAHAMMSQIDPMMLMDAAMQVRTETSDRDAVRAKVVELMAGSLDPVKAQSAAESSKEMVSQLTKEQYRALSLVLRELAPRRLIAFYNEVQGVTDANITKKLDESYDNLTTKSVAQLAAESQARAALFPVDAVTDKLIEAAGKVTPLSLETVVDKFAKAVTGSDFAKVGTSGLAFAEEFLTYASAEKPYSTQYSAQAAAFAPALKKVIQGAEDAIAASGIMAGMEDLKPVMKAYYDAVEKGASKKPRGPKGPAA